MQNSLLLSSSAKDSLAHAGGDAREKFYKCFDYIRENPGPLDPEGYITVITLPVGSICSFDDGYHLVGFLPEKIPETGAFIIHVLEIDMPGTMLPY